MIPCRASRAPSRCHAEARVAKVEADLRLVFLTMKRLADRADVPLPDPAPPEPGDARIYAFPGRGRAS